jgi:ComF family protein
MGLPWKSSLKDLLFPPLCIACREPGGSGGFCAECWSKIQFLDGPLCARCGIPFDVPLEDALCAACLAHPPAFDAARAILRYDDTSRLPILALKHADRLDLVPGFALWLERAGRGLIEASDLIVPVPLHPLRLWRRRYNQAAELARALARRTGLALDTAALVRRRPTPSQGSMATAKRRRRNVLGAFAVPQPNKVAARNILLVDDVVTTGATAEAAARALKRAGAAKVRLLALARVVRAAELPI